VPALAGDCSQITATALTAAAIVTSPVQIATPARERPTIRPVRAIAGRGVRSVRAF